MRNIIFTSIILLLSFPLFAQSDYKNDEVSEEASYESAQKASFASRMSSGDYSQIGLSAMPGQQMMALTVSSLLSRRKITYDEVEGSPYLNEKPVKGIVVMNDGRELIQVPLKLDLYAQTVVATNDQGVDISLDPQVYKTIIMPFNNELLTLKKVHVDKPDVFFSVLYEDNDIIFFRENYVTFRDATSNGVSDTEARFTPRKNYYIKYRTDKKPIKVKLKKKSILESLPKKKSNAVSQYAKKRGLKLQTEIDFIRAFLGTKPNSIKS